HLVYGDQLRDKMVFHGCAPESMQVVGTPTFDVTPHRDIVADQAYLAGLFPHIADKKLVVVATEAFAHPLIEFETVLRSVADMEDVAVVLKVHPSDSELFFNNFVDSLGNASNIRVIQKCELLPLLHVADLLIAVVSNIIVTAAALGTPTLVCDFSGKSKVVKFVAERLCEGCYSPHEVATTIRSLLFDETTRAAALRRLQTGVKRFNGPNDGNSHKRIASYIQSVGKKTSTSPGASESSFETPMVQATKRG